MEATGPGAERVALRVMYEVVAGQAWQAPNVEKNGAVLAVDAAVGDGSCLAAECRKGADGVQDDAFAVGCVDQGVAGVG